MQRDPHNKGLLDLVIHNKQFAEISSVIVTILVGLGIITNESLKDETPKVVPIVIESQSPETNLHNPETKLNKNSTNQYIQKPQKPQQTPKSKAPLYPPGSPPTSDSVRKSNPLKPISNSEETPPKKPKLTRDTIRPIKVGVTKKPQL